MEPRAVNEHDEAAYPEHQLLTFQPPGDMPQCLELQVLTSYDSPGDESSVSFWKPTEEELAHLINGSSIQLTICGRGMPPVALSVTGYV